MLLGVTAGAVALREREFQKKKATFPFSLLLPRSAACWLAGLFRSSLRRVFVTTTSMLGVAGKTV
jgi:hypothetical protein